MSAPGFAILLVVPCGLEGTFLPPFAGNSPIGEPGEAVCVDPDCLPQKKRDTAPRESAVVPATALNIASCLVCDAKCLAWSSAIYKYTGVDDTVNIYT